MHPTSSSSPSSQHSYDQTGIQVVTPLRGTARFLQYARVNQLPSPVRMPPPAQPPLTQHPLMRPMPAIHLRMMQYLDISSRNTLLRADRYFYGLSEDSVRGRMDLLRLAILKRTAARERCVEQRDWRHSPLQVSRAMSPFIRKMNELGKIASRLLENVGPHLSETVPSVGLAESVSQISKKGSSQDPQMKAIIVCERKIPWSSSEYSLGVGPSTTQSLTLIRPFGCADEITASTFLPRDFFTQVAKDIPDLRKLSINHWPFMYLSLLPLFKELEELEVVTCNMSFDSLSVAPLATMTQLKVLHMKGKIPGSCQEFLRKSLPKTAISFS